MEPQNTNVMMNQPTRSPIGPVIGLIVILAIIIVGGLYFWGERVNETATIDTAPTVQEQQTENVFETQGSLDDLNSIEADINATDFGSIDAGIEEIQ